MERDYKMREELMIELEKKIQDKRFNEAFMNTLGGMSKNSSFKMSIGGKKRSQPVSNKTSNANIIQGL